MVEKVGLTDLDLQWDPMQNHGHSHHPNYPSQPNLHRHERIDRLQSISA